MPDYLPRWKDLTWRASAANGKIETMTFSRRVFAMSAIASAALLAACSGGGSTSSSAASQYEQTGDRALGLPEAAVTVIEYSSVSCPHCAEFHEQIFPLVEERFIETGQVRFVMREMLYGSASLAQAGFLIARCAPEDRYFDVIDMLFDQQQAIFQAAQSPNGARDTFWNIARTAGLSRDEFNACIANSELRQEIIASHEAAEAAGINGTPRFVINGHILEAGRHGGQQVYFWNEEPLLVDGEPVPSRLDADTFTRILVHFVDSAGSPGN